jgi:hypothetical protein
MVIIEIRQVPGMPPEPGAHRLKMQQNPRRQRQIIRRKNPQKPTRVKLPERVRASRPVAFHRKPALHQNARDEKSAEHKEKMHAIADLAHQWSKDFKSHPA